MSLNFLWHRYIDRSSILFSGAKDTAQGHFCYMEFSVYFTMDIRADYSSEYQPDEYQHKLIQEIHEECHYK